jgi:hypothetical protein
MNLKLLTILISFICLVSCRNENKNVSSSSLAFETDSVSLKLKYAETSFIVPSPAQTSILLKKCNILYYDNLATPTSVLQKFTTTTKKSLALGIFGADLSYLNLYEQRESAMKYLQNVQTLLTDLEISSSIDKVTLKKIESNFGNSDSVLYYLADLYKNSDLYLKANDRRDVCSLIIAGGWVESFYFLTEIYNRTHKEDIFTLILYQSNILDNLIKLLSPYYERSPEFTQLIDELVNIAYEFDVVDKVQTITKTETDPIKKLTLVQNQTKHILTGSKLDNIVKYASVLRNKIILQ